MIVVIAVMGLANIVLVVMIVKMKMSSRGELADEPPPSGTVKNLNQFNTDVRLPESALKYLD